MMIQSKHFGALEFAEEKIITFPRGLVAFEQIKRYIIIENSQQGNPLCWLQAVDDPELAFVLINPFIFKEDYGFDLSAEEAEELALQNPGDAAVFAIVVVPEEAKKMTANLLAPLVINAQSKKGKQVILQEKNYSTRHLIFDELEKMRSRESGEGCKDACADQKKG